VDEHAELDVLHPLDLVIGLLLDPHVELGDPQRGERERLGGSGVCRGRQCGCDGCGGRHGRHTGEHSAASDRL